MFCIQIQRLLLGASTPEVLFEFKNEPIDVIIPVHSKDIIALEFCIEGIKKNCQNVRRIITISDLPYTSNAEWVSESIFPFNLKEVTKILSNNGPQSIHTAKWNEQVKSRSGWYFQQLLKLYAPFLIENISSNVLIVDSDLIFLNPVHFLNQLHAGLYTTSTSEIHLPYFLHAKRLLGGNFKRKDPRISAIVNHMLFQKSVLQQLFETIETAHQMPLWEAFCRQVDPKLAPSSGASEYEIYFNFVFAHSSKVDIRPLKWRNVKHMNSTLLKDYEKKYDYVCWQSYLR